MNDTTSDVSKIRAHPMPGWFAVLPSKVDGVIKQEVTEEAIDKFKVKLERELETSGGVQMVSLQDLIFGGNRPVPRQPVTLDREQVREVIEQSYSVFESAIVVEIGVLPPGYELENKNGEPLAEGDKVFYHEGRDLQIGELSFIRIDNIICWA